MEIETFVQTSKARRMARTGAALAVREAAGLSYAEIAAVVGVHPTSVRDWENGVTMPRPDHAAKWMTVLGSLQ